MANGVSPSSQAAPTPATWGVAQRLGGIFVSPTETFRAIVRDPDILPPLVILIGISVVTWELILSRIGIAQVLRSQLEMSGRASSMTPDQVQKYVSTASKYAPIIGRFAALVSVPFFILVVALIGLALMKAIFGLQFQFKTAYSVTTYAWLPWILSGLLAIAVVLFGD
ncbi:MAG: YIP1 family protein, partial [Terriglobia bacterium]